MPAEKLREESEKIPAFHQYSYKKAFESEIYPDDGW
jgi:hypothetical protein